jgi:hypothetical protein
MASNVLKFEPRAKAQSNTPCAVRPCIIASFGQAKALRDLPRHLKAGAL